MVNPRSESRRAIWLRRAVLSAGLLSSLAAGWSDQFDPLTRARMLLALLGVTVLGIGMIVMLVLGGRFIRRRIHAKPRQASRVFASDWGDRPRRKPPADNEENE